MWVRERTKITGIIIQNVRERKWSVTRHPLPRRPMHITYHQLKTAREEKITRGDERQLDRRDRHFLEVWQRVTINTEATDFEAVC